ncbi:cyclic peptide export ABC transporter [Burkholderia metallica]|uniref:cyclic peptide export ABC transporter n=1 Tax=Burkholderia metallica TaxID=488729 RepID=UPI000841F2FF|nr:cyclic peptide export ABC transporter [Burkholderia metallica]AOJ36094.1 ABC transporter [Burkholderia metallica]
MKLLSFLYRQSPKSFLFAILVGILSGFAGAGLAGVIGNSISHEATPALAYRFFGLCFLYLLSKSISENALLRLSQDVVLKMRVSLSKKLLATPYASLQSKGNARLLVILTKDIEAFSQAAQLVPVAFGNSIVILACLAYIASLSRQVFAFTIATLLIGTIGFHFAERRPLINLKKIRAQHDLLYEHFRNLIEGIKELQLNSVRSAVFMDKVLGPAFTDFKRLFVGSMSAYTWVLNIGSLLFYFVIGMLLFFFPVLSPQKTGILPNIALVLLYLIRPVTELMSTLPPIRQATISLHRIRQLDAELPDSAIDMSGANPFEGVTATGANITVTNLCHQYFSASDDRHFTLGPLNLAIGAGELLFIVGGNGSGKTTLAMLLLGLYAPEQGTIELNGVRVDEHNRAHYRQNFSAVLSDFHLFEHLLNSDGKHGGERALHYIRALAMQHKVRVVDGKFSTINLSTGQRKRLALIQAYLDDRPIFLFDEWAADQDPAFKRIFYTELLPELKARGKTVIAITHDDTYFELADRVIRLEDGKIHDASDFTRVRDVGYS